jgi:sodium transport system permease protein
VTLRPRIAWTVYGKELRETLRDRRTLVVMILLPLTLYPLLTLLFANLAVAQRKEEGERPSLVCLGKEATAHLRTALLARRKIELAGAACGRADLEARRVHVLVDVPQGFEEALFSDSPRSVRLLYDETEDASRLGLERTSEAIQGYVAALRRGRLLAAKLPETLVGPAPIEETSVASARDHGAALLARIVPMLLVFMVVLGAFYPAIDLTAGERERGTLETLLVAPITRLEIVVGKWLAVASIATLTGLLNLTSMGLTVGRMAQMALAGERSVAPTIRIPWSSLLASGIAIVPAALFFSALFMAVAALARSYKEAQAIVMPAYLCASLPALFAVLSGTELTIGTALVPGAGISLLVRAVIQGRVRGAPAGVALAAMAVYAGLALALAAGIYASEETLAGGAGVSPAARVRALFGWRRATDSAPARTALTPAEAMTLYSLLLCALIFLAVPMQQRAPLPGLLATQWGMLLPGVVIFLRLQRIDLGAALSIRRPSAKTVAAAILLGLSTWLLLSVFVEATLAKVFELHRFVEQMKRTLMPADSPRPLAFDLFLIAASPAICEELFFRGALLSGLRRTLSPWAAALVCGVLFGIFHLDLVRLLPTAVLGTILAWLTLAGGSILPAMIFHFLNNASAVLVTRFEARLGLSFLGTTAPLGLVGTVVAGMLFVAGVLLLRSAARDVRSQNATNPQM